MRGQRPLQQLPKLKGLQVLLMMNWGLTTFSHRLHKDRARASGSQTKIIPPTSSVTPLTRLRLDLTARPTKGLAKSKTPFGRLPRPRYELSALAWPYPSLPRMRLAASNFSTQPMKKRIGEARTSMVFQFLQMEHALITSYLKEARYCRIKVLTLLMPSQGLEYHTQSKLVRKTGAQMGK